MSKIINDYGKNKEILKIKTKSFYDENIYIRITYTIIYNTIYVYILYIIYIYNNLIYYSQMWHGIHATRRFGSRTFYQLLDKAIT